MLHDPKRTFYGYYNGGELIAIATISLIYWSSRYLNEIDPHQVNCVKDEMIYLTGVYICPVYRGYNRMLNFLEYLIKYRNSIISDLYLVVATHNLSAIKLYLKLGFIITNTLPARKVADGIHREEYLMKLVTDILIL